MIARVSNIVGILIAAMIAGIIMVEQALSVAWREAPEGFMGVVRELVIWNTWIAGPVILLVMFIPARAFVMGALYMYYEVEEIVAPRVRYANRRWRERRLATV